MLWWILTLILICLFSLWCLCFLEKGDEEDCLLFVFLSVIIVIFPIIFTIIGLTVYPNMVAQRAGCLALQSEIETIRQAHYSEVKSGQFVGGAMDNFEQSKALSTYISEYAKEKARYNSDLARYKLYQRDEIYRWLWYGFLIPKKIQELRPL